MHLPFLHHSVVRVNRPPLKEQLRWQCRRGMLELDFVMQRYLDNQFDTADAAEQTLFADLLTAQDPELQAWILNGVRHSDPSYQGLIDKIRGI